MSRAAETYSGVEALFRHVALALKISWHCSGLGFSGVPSAGGVLGVAAELGVLMDLSYRVFSKSCFRLSTIACAAGSAVR